MLTPAYYGLVGKMSKRLKGEKGMAEAKGKGKRVRLLTPVFRACFVNVFNKARQMEDSSGEPKYEITMVFDKAYLKKNPDELARFNAMRAAADAACLDKFKKPIKDVKFSTFHNPFRDGAEKEHLGGFGEGTLFVKASSKMKPGIVGPDRVTPIDDADAVYPGCYMRATVGFYGFDNRMKGVGCGLNNLMFVRDGERLDGRTDPSEDFGEVPAMAGADGDMDDML